MNKLKQYEIEAIVSTIQNQIKEIKSNERRDELDPAEVKLAELLKQEREVYLTLEKLKQIRLEFVKEVSTELKAYYCTTTNKFIARLPNPMMFNEIRNKVIISQINPDTNIEQVIKNIVEEFIK